MFFMAPHSRVTLVHHHSLDAPPFAVDCYVPETPAHVIEPSRRQCHYRRVVRMVLVVALGWAASVSALLKAVQGEVGAGVA